MPRKKPKPRRIEAVAKSAISKFQARGHSASEAPTPQRLIRARGGARIEKFFEVVEVAKGDGFEAVSVGMVRVRMEDDPFTRLSRDGRLAPGNPKLNAVLAKAGVEYRTAWSKSGMSGVKAADPEKPFVSGSSPGLFASEAQSNAFGRYCAAAAAMHRKHRVVVDAIVLSERDVIDVGRQISPYKQAKMATAAALSVLRLGLSDLAAFLGYIPMNSADAS